MAVLEFWRHRLPLAPSPNDLIKLRDYRSYRSPCMTLKSGNYTVSTTDFELQSMDDDIHPSSTAQVNRVVEPYPVWGPSVGPTASGTELFQLRAVTSPHSPENHVGSSSKWIHCGYFSVCSFLLIFFDLQVVSSFLDITHVRTALVSLCLEEDVCQTLAQTTSALVHKVTR